MRHAIGAKQRRNRVLLIGGGSRQQPKISVSETVLRLCEFAVFNGFNTVL